MFYSKQSGVIAFAGAACFAALACAQSKNLAAEGAAAKSAESKPPESKRAESISALSISVVSKLVEKDGLSAQLLLQSSVVDGDEQPDFIFRLRNTSKADLELYGFDGVWNWQIQFTNVDQTAPYPGPGPWQIQFEVRIRRPVEIKRIKAGETIEVPLDLNKPQFPFSYRYEGPQDKPVKPVKQLPPGKYQLAIKIDLQAGPVGNAGANYWTGTLATHPVEVQILAPGEKAQPNKPTAKQIAQYDRAIDQVVKQLDPRGTLDSLGMWTNGRSLIVEAPLDAKPEANIAEIVKRWRLTDSDSLRVLQLRQFKDDPPRPTVSVALIQLGGKAKVLVFFLEGDSKHWRSRWYDADYEPAATPAMEESKSTPESATEPKSKDGSATDNRSIQTQTDR
ncbi:MAG TPA: hypothetical protein VGJ15_04985, partial [Pirellulales bacterium]